MSEQPSMPVGPAIVTVAFGIALLVFFLASTWKIYVKAGRPGWAVLVPFYNLVVLLQIVGKPVWWLLLFLVPCVSWVVAIFVAIELARVFGKGLGFGLGLAFLPFVFYPVLGFGDAVYEGQSLLAD